MIFDHKQTQATHGFNYTDAFYEEQALKVQEDYREKKWPSPEEFWASTDKKTFRIYYPKYSEQIRFKKWLKVQVNFFNFEKDKTMDQILDEKYGKLDDYTDYDKIRTNDSLPAVYYYTNRFTMEKDEKEKIVHEENDLPVEISLKNGGEEFNYDEWFSEEARKMAGKK